MGLSLLCLVMPADCSVAVVAGRRVRLFAAGVVELGVPPVNVLETSSVDARTVRGVVRSPSRQQTNHLR